MTSFPIAMRMLRRNWSAGELRVIAPPVAGARDSSVKEPGPAFALFHQSWLLLSSMVKPFVYVSTPPVVPGRLE